MSSETQKRLQVCSKPTHSMLGFLYARQQKSSRRHLTLRWLPNDHEHMILPGAFSDVPQQGSVHSKHKSSLYQLAIKRTACSRLHQLPTRWLRIRARNPIKTDDSLAFCGLLHPLKAGSKQVKAFTTFNKWKTGGKSFTDKKELNIFKGFPQTTTTSIQPKA